MKIYFILLKYIDQSIHHINVGKYDSNLVNDQILHMLSIDYEYAQETMISTYCRTCALHLQHQCRYISFSLFELHVQQESEDTEYPHVQHMEKQCWLYAMIQYLLISDSQYANSAGHQYMKSIYPAYTYSISLKHDWSLTFTHTSICT